MEPHRQEDISKKIIRNTTYNVVGRFWGFLVTLFLTPYIIHHIGIERFGVLSIIGIITAYFSMLDFGLSTSYIKYIAEYYAKKEYGKINQLVGTGFVFYFIFASAVIVLAFFFMEQILVFLNIPFGLYDEVTFAFRIGIILFGFANVMSVFGALQDGLQRMDISNKVSIFVSVINIAGVVFFLEKGYGLRGLMVNNAIIFIVISIINVIVAFKIFPKLLFNPLLFDKGMFKKLFSFGYKLQASKIADVVLFQTDRFLIAYFLNIGLVGVYQLGTTVIQYARQVPLLLISALLPAASEMDARREEGKIQALYIRGSKYLVLASLPIIFFTIITADIIMRVWMGPGYEKAAWVIQLLGIGYLFNLNTGVGVTIYLGKGKPGLQMKAAILVTVINVILSVFLAIKIGFIGVAIATTTSFIVGTIYFFVMVHREIGLPLKSFFEKVIKKPLLICLLMSLAVLSFNYFTRGFDAQAERLVVFAKLVFEVILFIVIYLVLMLRSAYLDQEDRVIWRKVYSTFAVAGNKFLKTEQDKKRA